MPDGSNPSTLQPFAVPVPHEPGVYFGLPEDEYHADPSLGSTDLKNLICDVETYWEHSRFNPARPDTETEAKLKGQALHKMVLEGPQSFDRAFIIDIDPANHPKALVTGKDLEAFCKARNIKGYSGKPKPELIKLVKEADPEAQIWDDTYALFLAMCARDGKKVLKPKTFEEIKQAAARMAVNTNLTNAFTGGMPEVSVFWVDERGVPCKCRIDFLKPRMMVDLKKCDNTRGRPFDFAIRRAIVDYRYDVQVAHYFQGYRALYDFAHAGQFFGDAYNNWHKLIAPPPNMDFTFVFRSTQGAPICKGLRMRRDSAALNRATREIAQAKATYIDCLNRFGTDPWVSNTPIEDLTDADLPVWMREETEAL